MEQQFHMLLYRTFHAQRSVMRPKGAALGLGSGQPKLIDRLARHGPCSQKQLAEYFEIDPAAVCRMLDALEKGGFVRRGVDKTDRRAGTVRLTEKGAQAAAAWQRAAAEVESQMLAGFTPEERAQFAAYLRRVYGNLRPGSAFLRQEAAPAAQEEKTGEDTTR